MATRSGLQIGDRVFINLDVETFQELQQDPGWNPEMRHCRGRIGKVINVQYHSVEVEFGAGERWNLNEIVLSQMMPLGVGDRVKVIDDERRLIELQRDHGGWIEGMASIVGQEGVVKRVFDDQDLKVEIAGRGWTFNPVALIPVDPPTVLPNPHPIPVSYSPADLFDSVQIGDIGTIRDIAHSNPQLLKKNVNGLNALHIACQVGLEDVVSFLTGQGMDPNQPDTQGRTPLMLCCEVISNPLCVRHLLQAGARPNDCGKLNNKYPLLLAIEFNHNEICEELLDSRKCNVNVKDNFTQDTALHIAARVSNLNIVMNLLDAGADPYAINSAGLPPIHVAIMSNSQKVIGYIIGKMPDLVYMKAKRGEYFGMTAVHLAILLDKKDSLVSLLECEAVDLELRDDRDKLTPFLFAVAKDRYHMLDVLLENGCDVHSCDSLGNNALHILFISNCDNYDTRLINDPILLSTFREVEQYYGAHIRISMCCYLMKIRVPYQRKNEAGVHPLSELNPDIRRFCEDRAPGLLPDCILCNRLSEFRNSPCEHVTYCVVHAIEGSRCNTCGVDITSYISLVPFANQRRRKIQAARMVHSLSSPAVPSFDTPIHSVSTPRIPVSKPPEPAPPKEEPGGECGICYGSYSEVNKVLIDPCGHTCCRTCGGNLVECHICRQPILKLINVFD